MDEGQPRGACFDCGEAIGRGFRHGKNRPEHGDTRNQRDRVIAKAGQEGVQRDILFLLHRHGIGNCHPEAGRSGPGRLRQCPNPRFPLEEVFPLRDEEEAQASRRARRIEDEGVNHCDNQEADQAGNQDGIGALNPADATVDDYP